MEEGISKSQSQAWNSGSLISDLRTAPRSWWKAAWHLMLYTVMGKPLAAAVMIPELLCIHCGKISIKSFNVCKAEKGEEAQNGGLDLQLLSHPWMSPLPSAFIFFLVSNYSLFSVLNSRSTCIHVFLSSFYLLLFLLLFVLLLGMCNPS